MKPYRFILLALIALFAFAPSALAANINHGLDDSWGASVSPNNTHGDEEWTHIDADAPTDANGKGVPSAYKWISFATYNLDKTKTYTTVTVDAFTWYGGQKVTLDQVAPFNYATVTWNTQPSATVTGLATVSQTAVDPYHSRREHYTFLTSSILDGSGNIPSTLYFRLRLTKGTGQEVYMGAGFMADGVCEDEIGTTNDPVNDPAWVEDSCF